MRRSVKAPYLRRARLRAAFFAAAERPRPPLVRAARRAAAERLARVRFCAAERACRDRDFLDAADLPARLSAPWLALERRRDVCPVVLRPAANARLALLRAFPGTVPFFGGVRRTPARRALDKPIAIACLVEPAPCLPCRIWCISSRTNSPAWVLAALPWRFACFALSIVRFSSIAVRSRFFSKCQPQGACRRSCAAVL